MVQTLTLGTGDFGTRSNRTGYPRYPVPALNPVHQNPDTEPKHHYHPVYPGYPGNPVHALNPVHQKDTKANIPTILFILDILGILFLP